MSLASKSHESDRTVKESRGISPQSTHMDKDMHILHIGVFSYFPTKGTTDREYKLQPRDILHQLTLRHIINTTQVHSV